LAFATFLVWRLRIGACGVGAYDSYPNDSFFIFTEIVVYPQVQPTISGPRAATPVRRRLPAVLPEDPGRGREERLCVVRARPGRQRLLPVGGPLQHAVGDSPEPPPAEAAVLQEPERPRPRRQRGPAIDRRTQIKPADAVGVHQCHTQRPRLWEEALRLVPGSL